MTTYYAIFQRPGAQWNPERPVREQQFWDEHARFVDSLFDAGVVILAGPFADRTGSLVIVTADSVEQVYEIFRSDPWAQHDVLVAADVKEWTIFLDARTRS
ncbi:MAG TPA: YciI family protein [Blastocatellia bacterium]|nr:YciI family protein [Blastocatellia bacterium]